MAAELHTYEGRVMTGNEVTSDTTGAPEPTAPPPARVFRVEHRVPGSPSIVLARIRDVFPHHATLTPYVSCLLRECGGEPACGELVLVDEATDEVLARRGLGHGLARRRPTPRRQKYAL